MSGPQHTAWCPQPGPQKALIDCPFGEILYGGARGGGKTDGVLGKFGLKEKRYGSGFNGVFFRREMPQADDLIERAKEIFLPTGAEWREQSKTFLMPHGGRLRFRPLENVADAQKYQGQNLSDAAVEEAGNYPDSKPIDMLFGALRSKTGVPIQLILTANPGGPGHQWIKARYIDPAPLGNVPLQRKMPTGKLSHRYIYIPSRVSDNRVLMANDPTYVDRLALTGSAELVRAWLNGDWDVIAGAYFPEWSSERHVIPPRELPAHWLRYRAFDWGSARPFACLWLAVSDGTLPEFPRGALVVYREWYGCTGQPNEGLRMPAETVAEGIAAREVGDNLTFGVADPAIFASDGGPSIAERMHKSARVLFRAADNARVARGGAMGGWDQLRSRLIGEDGKPMLYVFSTCAHLIRTLPALQHDEHKPEDVDTEGEDHAPDALRYGCMARPYVRDAKKHQPGALLSVGAGNQVKFNDLWKTARRSDARL